LQGSHQFYYSFLFINYKTKRTFFTLFEIELSGRDLIVILGGLFLLAKSPIEIHSKLDGEEEHQEVKAKVSFKSVIIKILLHDVVFSIDSYHSNQNGE
jgi:predicted tellurium resistance membrane protein TerC